MCSHWCGGLCPGAIPYQFCRGTANIRLFTHHDITQAPSSVFTMVQNHRILGFYGTGVYVMVNRKLPLEVPSQCSAHRVEYFLGNIDIYDCF